jgi:hypothetical protein
MPYKSLAQAAYFNIHRKELERKGVDVDEWNDSTRGKKLPKKVKKAGLLDVDLLLKTAAEATFVHGIHGDEPAGTLALKEKGEDSVDAGNHTGDRKMNGKDLNRHIGKDSPILKAVLKKNPKLVVDLHEDNDASGVYAYTSPSQKEKVKKILSSIGGLPVAGKGDGEKTDGGVISSADGPYSGSLERVVAKKKIPYVTLETPGKKPLEDRVDYQKKFIDKIKKGEVDFKPDYTPEQLKDPESLQKVMEAYRAKQYNRGMNSLKDKLAARGDQILKLLSSAGPMQMPREMGNAIEMLARKDIGMLKQMEPQLNHGEALSTMAELRGQQVPGIRSLNKIRRVRNNLDKTTSMLDGLIDQLRPKQGELLKESARFSKSYYKALAKTNPKAHQTASSLGGKNKGVIQRDLARKAENKEKHTAQQSTLNARLEAYRNPPKPPQGELDFGKQAHVSSEMNRVLYNHLLSRGVSAKADPNEVLERRSPREKDLNARLRGETIGSSLFGGIAGYGIADNVAPFLKPNLARYSGRVGTILGGLATGGLGYAYGKKKNDEYTQLSKKKKLKQINKFIEAKKKKEPMRQWGNPVVNGAAAAGFGTLYYSLLRRQIEGAVRDAEDAARYYAEQHARRGAYDGYSGERFNGSGNQGGGGKSDYKNPHTGDMADKYDKFMAMKRMAAEGATEGERSNAVASVEKWKKKYKFASMLKIASLFKY